MKKVTSALLAAMLLAATLAGCGSPSSSEQPADGGNGQASTADNNGAGDADAPESGSIPTIRFAYNWTGTADPKNATYEQLILDYVEAHKDSVNIVLETASGMTLQDKIKVDLAAGELPDLFMYWGGESNLANMVNNGLLVDVDTYCAESPTIRRDQWDESTFLNSTLDGKEFMFPVESFKWFTIYNKAVFDEYDLEIPTTYKDLQACNEVFKANDITTINVGSLGGEYGHIFYNAVLFQLGNTANGMQDLATSHQFDSEATREAARIIAEMRDDGMFPSDTIANGGSKNAALLYTQNKAAMMLCAPFILSQISEEVLDTSVIAPFPAMPGATDDPATFSMGAISEGLCITTEAFNDPAKKAALIDFADFLLSDEVFNAISETTTMPAKNIELDPANLDPWIAKAIEASNNKPTYQPVWFLMPTTDTSSAYLDGIDELFAGAISDTDFVDKVQAAFDAI